MLTFIENTTGIVTVRFSDTDPVIPDVGSVTYEIRDASGVPYPGFENKSVTTFTTTTQISIPVPASLIQITPGKLFDRKHIVIFYNVQGVSQAKGVSFRVIKKIDYTVSEQDVRDFCGVSVRELPSTAIDLYNCYLSVVRSLGTSDILDAALVSGTLAEVAANDLIKMTAVLVALPSLQQRVMAREEDGVLAFQRMNIKNFDEIKAAALSRLEEAWGEVRVVTESAYTLVVTTQDTDVITGA